MNIETILRIILLFTAAFSLGVLLLARKMAPKSIGLTVLRVCVTVWSVVTVGAGLAFYSKIGPIVAVEGVFLAIAPTVALTGGSAKDRDGKSKAVPAAAALVLLAGDLTAFYVLNHTVVEMADTLGFNKPRTVQSAVTNKDCPENLKALYFAFDKYVEGNGSLPPADKWMENEEISSKVQKDEWFHCPDVSNRHDNKFGYAYNEAIAGKSLDGKKLSQMPDAARTPLMYDSTNVARSAHDKYVSLPSPGRHGGKNNILFCDGHVESVPDARR